MSLPEFNTVGDLPPGIHRAPFQEVLKRFGGEAGKREACTRRLAHVFELAKRTGFLQRFVIFGSYITSKHEPNDVDVVLVMADTFHLSQCPAELKGLFDHAVAQARYGASVFWTRPAILIGETVEEFIAYWQIKRGRDRRGIVDVII
jgi:hypothetical protein